MYEEYYGLTEPPFSLTPDPHYFYRSDSHNRAHELLSYGITRREGFMVLYGDIGMGKTTLCRTVLETTDNNVHTALLLNPFLSEMDLIKAVLDDFGVTVQASEGGPQSEQRKASLLGNKQDMINALNAFLLKNNESGGRAVVLIDEAQNIPLATLEQIRVLSNLETDKQKLLQIVLIGQMNLLDVLSAPELRQLHQRISIKCELVPLTKEEVNDYLRHRLSVAGGSQRKIAFTLDGVSEIYSYSGGVPRLINLIADRALLAGMSLGLSKIDRKAVSKAVEALQLPRRPTVHGTDSPQKGQWGKRVALTVGLSLLLATVLVLVMYLGGYSR
jgi:general secretion pathway protein A